ncbi:MAG: sulfatase [Firmicutes bacterium]|nr:sulfatase [Bacillota bacterium]
MMVRGLNLVVICLDTFRYDCLTHQAPWPVYLPHLDRLRAESTVYQHAYPEGLPTIPVRRAYFTGERSFPWRFRYDTKGSWPTGRGWHKIPPEQPTLAEILLEAGYQTGLVADTYHLFKPTGNFTRGFLAYEFVRGYETDNYRAGRISPETLRRFVKHPDPAANPVLVQYLLNTEGRVREQDWTTAQVFLRASDFVLSASRQQPFFLWVDSFAPHEPWDPPRPYLALYGEDPEDDSILTPIYPVGYTANDLSPREIARTQALYLATLTFVDRWVGFLLDTLDRTGLSRNTVVMLVNDHGTELMDHGQFSKAPQRLFDHNTHMIWMIRYPGESSHVSDAFVQSHDVFPTALELLDMPRRPVAGTSAWPLRSAAPQQGPEALVTGWGSHASVRTRAWNFVVNFEAPEEHSLYHVATDPQERHDVHEDHPDVAAALQKILEDLLGQTLPARLSDDVRPSDAPVRTYYQSRIDQRKRDAGFV